MVASLIRLKLTLLRNSARGERQSLVIAGASVGLALALATVWLAGQAARNPAAQRDLLCLAVGMWVLGWGIAPVWAGQPLLQARHFALLGVPRGRLACGLLAASLVGIAGVLTVVALSSVAVFGARASWSAALFAVPVIVLVTLFALLLARLAGHAFSRLSLSRSGAVVTGALTGALLVLTQAGWMVLIVIETVRITGFSDGVAAAIRIFPSSWGVFAVEAFGAGERATATATITALAVLDAVMLGAWTVIVDAPLGRAPVIIGPRHRGFAWRDRMLPWPNPQIQAVVRREIAAWSRDPARIQALAAAVVFASATVALPLIVDSTALVPWVGCFAVVILVATTSNPYGHDGTALWLTMQIPGAVAAEVRGRQVTWGLVATAMALPLALIGWRWSGAAVLDQLALAGTALAIVAGAGIVVWLGVVGLVPGPDPRATRHNPLDHADVTAQSFASLGLVTLATAPLAGAVAVDLLVGLSGRVGAVVWTAVGIVYAFWLWWLAGSAAASRLEARAPELLLAMRSGGRAATTAAQTTATGSLALRPWEQTLFWSCVLLGLIALFPQALVPAAMKLTGQVERVWFVALYASEPWQWPIITGMAGLGAGLLATSYALYRRGRPRHP